MNGHGVLHQFVTFGVSLNLGGFQWGGWGGGKITLCLKLVGIMLET